MPFWNWFDGASLWVVIIVVAAVYSLAMLVIEWARWR